MSISEIVNYVNRTPHNTNPNVIASMVQGANEQAVYESVEKLKQGGGVGYSEGGGIVYDGVLEYMEDDGSSFVEGAPCNAGLISGSTYTVKLDSGEYYCVGKSTQIEGYGVVNYIGNAALLFGSDVAEDTGELFAAFTLQVGNGFIIVAGDEGGGTHATITGEKIYKIDPKYIPGLYVPLVEIADPNALTDEDKAKLNACIGSPICFKASSNGATAAVLMSYIGQNDGIQIFEAPSGTGKVAFMGNGADEWHYVSATSQT